VVAQLKQREAATCCTRRGRRGPVTSKGGRGPWGLARSSRNGLVSRSESMYPFCRYLRSLSIMGSYSVLARDGKTAADLIKTSDATRKNIQSCSRAARHTLADAVNVGKQKA
jgi:hypothetical protein